MKCSSKKSFEVPNRNEDMEKKTDSSLYDNATTAVVKVCVVCVVSCKGTIYAPHKSYYGQAERDEAQQQRER